MKFISEKCSWIGWIIFATGLGNQTKEEVMMACMMASALAACGSTGNDVDEYIVPEPSTTVEPAVETESEAETEKSTSPADTADEAAETEPEPEDTAATGLVVYFSWSGNTESVALEIQNQSGADTFRLVPAEPYTDDYDALLDIAQEEQRNGARFWRGDLE